MSARKLTFSLLVLYGFFQVHAELNCYRTNGLLASTDIQPCSRNLPSGSHSACCNLGKNPTDICMAGGLCYRQDGTDGNFLIFAVGCTDPTGKDPSCQQYCTGKSQEKGLQALRASLILASIAAENELQLF